MSAKKYDFDIEQGSSYRLSLKYKDENGIIIPLTDYCARIVWSTSDGNSQTFLTTDPANSNYNFYIDEVNGTINWLLSAEFTNSMTFLSAKYDLELSSPQYLYYGGGKFTTRLVYGTITIVPRFSKTNTFLDCVQ
jgi:hypothetical protein